MDNFTKKPYEISLWDEQLIWERRTLDFVQVLKDDYAPGKYYSQNSGAFGEVPFSLDFNEYNPGQRYYKLHSPQSSDAFETVIKGERPEDATVPDSWLTRAPQLRVCNILKFEEGQVYYTYSNGTEPEKWSTTKVEPGPAETPQEGVVYFKEETNISMPSVLNSYYKEYKLCTIGSDTMEAPFRAINGKFTTKINGENVLNFSIYYKYMDAETGQLKSNPFLPHLVNERKIKLRIGDLGKPDCRWYDLIIKQIQENSEKKTFQYTCKDQFVNELSKTGFELVFDNEMENNMGTVTYLGENILEGSDWRVGEDNSILRQYVEEPLYEVKLKPDAKIVVDNMLDSSDSITISGNQTVLVFYSHINEQQTNLQLLYAPNNKYQADDNLVIDKDFHPNYITKNTIFNENLPEWADSCNISENYRGMRLVRQPQTKYDATIDKYVSVYEKTVDGKKEEYYGFTKDEYLSPQSVFNYIVNPNSFTSTTGWVAETVEQGRPALSVVTYPQIGSFTATAWEEGLKEIKSYLAYTNIPKARIMNTSISSHRSTIKSLAKHKTWVVRLKNKVDAIANVRDENGVIENYDTENRPNIELAQYELDPNGSFKIVKSIISFGLPELNEIRPNDIGEDGNLLGPEAQENYIYYTGRVLCDVSEEELQNHNNRFGLFIQRNDEESKDYFIENIELFPLVTYFKDGEHRFCVPGGEFFSETRTDYYYYKPNKDITDIKQLTYESTSEGNPDTSFTQVFNDGEYTKTRSISGKESNRFNLLQDLCEKFECWIKYDIKRNPDTGEILLGMDLGKMDGDEAYRQQKFVVFKEYLRDEYNWAGFRYGINEKSIQRTIDSNQIVSKMIVKNNANEFATDGFCSIARAEENDIKENFLLDFDYYYQHKLLNLATVTNDLYLDSNGYIGYYKQLRQKNRDRDAKIKRQSNLLIDMMHYDSELQTYKTSYDAAVEEKNNIEGYILELTGLTFKTFSDGFNWEIFKYGVHGNGFSKDKVYYQYNNKTGEYYRTDHSEPQAGIAYYSNDAYAEWDCNKEFISYWTKYCQACNIAARHKPIYENAEKQLALVTEEYDTISAELEQLQKEKAALNLRFYKKYSRFLQEGSWISEDYVDDNLYYLDARSTLHTSTQPKVTYNISVLELSRLPGYENYKFELGDRTYIEDVEFFGYSLKDGVTPYREEIVINEISLELDSPEKNSIKVQNYKTQFDDLFSRITASTQQAEYHSGEYQRAANIIEEDGTIKVEGLEKAFEKNSIALSNAKDQSVMINEYGITTSNVSKPDQLVRIISGGIYISNDGGQTWKTGITGTGINTSVLTSGQLNTKEILITNGDSPSFRWNSQGINAFYIDSDNTYDPARFVRFDQYGIYGINGTSQNNFDLTPVSEKRIWDEAQFALTWKGFMLKRKGADGGQISISSEDDIVVQTQKTTIDDEGNPITVPVKRIQIGDIGTDDKPVYGIRIADAEGNSVMETNDDGSLWLKNQLHIETYKENTNVSFGKLDTEDTKDPEHGGRIINANERFVVYDDGFMKATGAEFEGTVHATGGEFTGTIYATGGQIGNVTIGEVETATVKLDIFSEMGYNFKVEVDKKPVSLELKAKATNINLNGASYSWKISKDLRSWSTLDITSNSLILSYDTFLENSLNNTAYVQLTVTLENETKYTATQQILAVTNGETAINVVITSTAGNSFRNGAYRTTLEARLFKGLEEIDEDGTEYSYTWTKTDDNTWSETGKEITIERQQIYGNVVLTCNIGFKEQTDEKEGEGDGQ